MLGGLQGWHLIIVLVVILLLFGASRLPQLARSIGQSTKVLRQELRDDKPAEGDASPSSGSTATNTAAPTTTTVQDTTAEPRPADPPSDPAK